jgi:hypothetical protein
MSNNFQLGRTLPSESRKNRELELERLAARKRRKTRNVVIITLVVIATTTILIWLITSIIAMVNDAHTANNSPETIEPTVRIVDENSGNHISVRTKTFIARLERDLYDLGYSIDHVVLPFQKAREIDIYLTGHNEFYKMSIDRSSATQAEDAERMIRYLDENNITASYVDLRLEGKAYYK